MGEPIVIWGASGQAKVLHEFIGSLGYELVALFDNDESALSPFPNVPIYYKETGFKQWHSRNRTLRAGFLVAVGGDRGKDRLAIGALLQRAGLRPLSVVHPTAFVAADAVLAQGAQILAQAAVCTRAIVGPGCIVNTGAGVDHECVLGEGVHIGPGAALGGCVRVGAHTFIGTGAVILPHVVIGPGCIIGAGSVVTRDVPEGKVAFGNPARVRRHA